jgi:pyrroloquinoline quinone (PQQ) biosynthesis protein C
MQFHERLTSETSEQREALLAHPLVQTTIRSGASRGRYLDFLTEAYHHVKYFFPLLALAASRADDPRYQAALVEYMKEERDHESRILNDIRAIGGDADAVRRGEPRAASRIMVSYAQYAIEQVSPYAMVGSVHALECMSALMADRIADAVKGSLKLEGDLGFSYLRSHGRRDQKSVALFHALVDGFEERQTQQIIIESSRFFYRLYAAVFHDLGAGADRRDAA